MHEPNTMVTEVQDLTSALLDDVASDEQVHRLEELLLANNEARRTYVTWVQLHADLHYLLGNKQSHLPLPTTTEPTETKPKGNRTKTKAPKKSTPLPQVDLPQDATHTPWSNGARH
jgi:hypothetical protein